MKFSQLLKQSNLLISLQQIMKKKLRHVVKNQIIVIIIIIIIIIMPVPVAARSKA